MIRPLFDVSNTSHINDDNSAVPEALNSVAQSDVSTLSSGGGGGFWWTATAKQTFHYDRLGLHGRIQESRLIMTALDRARTRGKSELVMVRGASGMGKSTLVDKLKDQMNKAGAYVVSGKFDQIRTNEPFSAIVAVITDLLDIIRHDHDSDLDSLDDNHTAKNVMDSEDAKLIQHLISDLYMQESTNNEDGLGGPNASERLTTCCCRFLRSVASYVNPVVIYLDDIQWADESSLGLTKALIDDPDSQNILIICTLRDPEATTEFVRSFLDSEHLLPVTDIQLDVLDLSNVNKIVSDLLGMSTEKTASLAAIVVKKTMGNPHFVVQYLESLHADGLMKFIARNNWEWDEHRILSETNVSSNVSDLVTRKIKRLPLDLQLLLKLAACLGFEFDRSLLNAFLLSNPELAEDSHLPTIGGTSIVDDKAINKLLEMAIDEGLIENKAQGKYKFSHDKVQQCLYDMIPDGSEKDFMHLRIGGLLLEMAQSSQQPQDWMVFAAANHLNHVPRSSFSGSMSPSMAAQVNLDAAKLSKKKAAFAPAVQFICTGISFLEEQNKWVEQYDLCRSLHSLLAEIEFAKGNIPRSKELVAETLSHARSLQDKLPVLYTMIDCLGTEGSIREAMDLGFSTLRELGERFPKKAGLLQIAWELLKTKRLLRRMTDQKLLDLPMMTDELNLARLQLATLISTYAPFLGEEKQVLVLYLRMIQVCIRGGNSYLSPTAFSMYAMIEAASGNTKSAARIAGLSLKMVDKIGHRQCGVLPISIGHCVLHWQEPMKDSLESLSLNVDNGIAWGQVKGVFYTLQVYFSVALYCGESLDKLEEQMRNCCEQKQKFNVFQESAVIMLMLIRPLWQAVLNLQGCAVKLDVLSGEAMIDEELTTQVLETGNYGAMVNFLSMQIQIAYMFGDYELTLKTSASLKKWERLFSFHFYFYSYLFYSGLAYVATAERTGEKMYKIEAKKFMKRLQKINNVNTRPLVQLLRAEYNALTSTNKDLIEIYYDEAVASSRKSALPNLEALANERAWIASSAKNIPEKTYYRRAVQLYAQWGATAKVEALQKQAASLNNTKSTTNRSTKNRQSTPRETGHLGGLAGPVWAC